MRGKSETPWIGSGKDLRYTMQLCHMHGSGRKEKGAQGKTLFCLAIVICTTDPIPILIGL